MPTWTGKLTMFAFAGLLSLAPYASATTYTRANKQDDLNHSVNNDVFESAFFTQSQDGLITFGPEGAWAPLNPAQAGQITTTTPKAHRTIVGDSTSAGADLTPGTPDDWIGGNGIPAGITLTYDVQFTISVAAGNFLTNPANSGSGLGNGIGIAQVQNVAEDIDLGETLNFSAVTVSNVNFTGTLSEPGFVFSAGAVSNYGYRVFRSNNFDESTEGLLLTQGTDTTGFGTSVGNVQSNLVINNNFGSGTSPSTEFIRRTGPFTLTSEGGNFAIKGVGLQYDVSYDISSAPVGEDADFNGDDMVDGADFLIWQQNAGIASDALQSQGNANPGVDGAVDATDLEIWAEQFGTSSAVAAAAAVPEPTAVALLVVGGGALVAAGTRGGKKRTS